MSSVSGNYSNYSRVSGLASGLDTEGIVKKMLATSTAKIDKVNQQKQLLQWKQEDYKSIVYKLMSFKDKYFSSTSSTNALTGGFYASKVVSFQNTDDSKYVSITVPSSTNITSVRLQNIQLATQSVAKTEQTVCNQIMMRFDAVSAPVDLTGKTIEMTVDGVTKTLTFSKAYDTSEQLAADLKQMTDSAFGTDRLNVTTSGDNIIINSDGASASLASGASDDALAVDGLTLLNNQTNRIDVTKSIENNSFATPVTGDKFVFTINGQRFEFVKETTINGIMNVINASSAGVKISYSSITDKFTLTSTATGSAGTISFSDETGNFMSAIIGPLTDSNYTQGTDASVYIDGTKVTRSSNTFTIDGITYNLKASTTNTIDANVTTDTSTVLNNIKNFVKDYNELLDTLYSKISETRYRDFLPLTDEQKKELSESEIKTWQEKARSGLLRNDTHIQKIITALREAMYTPVAKASDNSSNLEINLLSIGISSSDYTAKGKLVIDEQKLTEALLTNADAVINLFTQKSDKIYLPTNTEEVRDERYKESGLMYRLSDILDDNVRKTFGGGALLQVCGYEGTSTEYENLITKSIQNYEKKLTRLLDALTREENRYYSQFTAMEKYISQMNQQSQWLSNTFE